jgi:hypothetical protein
MALHKRKKKIRYKVDPEYKNGVGIFLAIAFVVSVFVMVVTDLSK